MVDHKNSLGDRQNVSFLCKQSYIY